MRRALIGALNARLNRGDLVAAPLRVPKHRVAREVRLVGGVEEGAAVVERVAGGLVRGRDGRGGVQRVVGVVRVVVVVGAGGGGGEGGGGRVASAVLLLLLLLARVQLLLLLRVLERLGLGLARRRAQLAAAGEQLMLRLLARVASLRRLAAREHLRRVLELVRVVGVVVVCVGGLCGSVVTAKLLLLLAQHVLCSALLVRVQVRGLLLQVRRVLAEVGVLVVRVLVRVRVGNRGRGCRGRGQRGARRVLARARRRGALARRGEMRAGGRGRRVARRGVHVVRVLRKLRVLLCVLAELVRVLAVRVRVLVVRGELAVRVLMLRGKVYGSERDGGSRLVRLLLLLGLAARAVLVVGVLADVLRAQPLSLVDERLLVSLGELLPTRAEPPRDLRIVHLWVLLCHLAPLPARPHHERVHRPLDMLAVRAGRRLHLRLRRASGAASRRRRVGRRRLVRVHRRRVPLAGRRQVHAAQVAAVRTRAFEVLLLLLEEVRGGELVRVWLELRALLVVAGVLGFMEALLVVLLLLLLVLLVLLLEVLLEVLLVLEVLLLDLRGSFDGKVLVMRVQTAGELLVLVLMLVLLLVLLLLLGVLLLLVHAERRLRLVDSGGGKLLLLTAGVKSRQERLDVHLGLASLLLLLLCLLLPLLQSVLAGALAA